MNKFLSASITALVLIQTAAFAGEEIRHYPSLEAPNTQVALCNLTKFNEKLQAITTKKNITPADMVKVHELTYTLENAVIRLQKDLDKIAVNLEKVHKGSEQLNQKVVKGSGKDYLAATKLILSAKKCP